MRTMQRLLLDSVILSVFVLLVNPTLTGIPVHEWVSLAVIVPIAAHLAVNRRWVARTTKRIFGELANGPRINWVVDAGLLIAAAAAMVSGFAVSESVLPALGLTWSAGAAWHSLHTWSAYVTFALTALHTALHWRWIERALGLDDPAPLRAYQAIPACQHAEAPRNRP